MKKRVISISLVVLSTMLFLAGCGDKSKTPATSSVDGINNPSSTVQESTTTPRNPLTGESIEDKDTLLNRSVAVMVNNIKAALPQRGISDADIIFELPVEGAITRLMAVFSDYKKVPEIGSIRSARHDFVEILKPFNPIYMHIGGSQAGKDSIKANKIDDIDGIAMSNIAFFQDKARLRTYASEHTWFSSFKLLNKGIEKKGFQTKLSEPMKPMFEFAKADEDVLATDTSAVATTKASIKFSNYCTATFDYDSQTKLYKKGEYGAPHLDTNKNQAAAVSNVLVMYTNVGYLPDKLHKEVDLSKGNGYYLSNGKRVEVTFEKKSVNDLLSVKDMSGKALKMNVGKTWFCIVPNEHKTSAQFK